MLLLNFCRTFTNPSPGERNVLEGVSSLISGIICSLKLGTIRHYSFNVCVRRDVFNFLFEDKGIRVCHRRGKMYNRSDFNNQYFNDDDFLYVNNSDECVRVVFPVYMYSYVKFVKLGNNRYDFCETVCVNLLKEHC